MTSSLAPLNEVWRENIHNTVEVNKAYGYGFVTVRVIY